ncbi:MAG: YbdD/YjiX family protein [Rudaea sp.]|uniref:YbdD/YjiX family protein n=1 Tax=unclassified Rudaea TaxID=2627037 RepID=UPI0010F493E7|nr:MULTISPECIES: YbdD/YjiX family protein [unclassified Rudaea]MBN8888288.1 YbdD/YjiX family protein [Rudaea sp.]MBR0347370.1 YbdD/YjiX family protein [Rudaea sp.]
MNGLVESLRHFWRRAVQTARLAIGVPDYDTYVLHLRRHHPERTVPSYEEFFRQRQDARYKNGGTRGCC